MAPLNRKPLEERKTLEPESTPVIERVRQAWEHLYRCFDSAAMRLEPGDRISIATAQQGCAANSTSHLR